DRRARRGSTGRAHRGAGGRRRRRRRLRNRRSRVRAASSGDPAGGARVDPGAIRYNSSGGFMIRFLAAGVSAIALYGANADLILHNGKIVTVDAAFSVSHAVAIAGGKISAVGSDAKVLKERGPSTRVIDLAGHTVLPGLVDSHVHALSAGLSEFR